MPFEFDPAKDAANRALHGIGLSEFVRFDAEPLVVADLKSDYGEERALAFGRIDNVLYCLVFTFRGVAIRLISLRRAREKELKRHEARIHQP